MPSPSLPSNIPQKVLILFGSFELDVSTRELRRDGEFVSLTPKAMDLLVLLASANGRVVEKQEIVNALWPGVVVEEGNLTQTAFLLRKVIEESPSEPVYVVTVPRRGYRLSGIRDAAADAPDAESAHSIGTAKPSSRRRIGVALAAGLGLIAAALFLLFQRSSPSVANATTPTRLVVLPFVNMSPEPAAEYLSDGLTEEIINALAGIEGLRVVARTTAFAFKGKAYDIRAIGKQLDVDAVLEGSVRKQGTKVRVTAQLNNVRDGYHFWSQTMEHEMSDTFALQRAIAASVASAFEKPVTPLIGGQRTRPVDTEAYNLYLRGLHEKGKVFGGALERAIALFKQAIDKAPHFAEAHAAIAYAYTSLGYTNQLPPGAAFPLAQTYWSRALELNSGLADAHTAKAITLLLHDRDLKGAELSFQKAIALNPSNAQAHEWYSHYLVAVGRMEDALRESRLALDTDVLSMDMNAHLSWNYYMAGDYSKSIDAAHNGLGIDPAHVPSKIYLAWSLMGAGRLAEAMDLDEQIPRADSADIPKWREAYRRGGARAYWAARVESGLKVGRTPLALARYWICAGRKKEALDALEEAWKARAPAIIYLKTDPVYEPLRNEPRFISLAREIGLP